MHGNQGAGSVCRPITRVTVEAGDINMPTRTTAPSDRVSSSLFRYALVARCEFYDYRVVDGAAGTVNLKTHGPFTSV